MPFFPRLNSPLPVSVSWYDLSNKLFELVSGSDTEMIDLLNEVVNRQFSTYKGFFLQ